MKRIWLQRKHLKISQELDWMPGGVSTFLRISRSVNSPKLKVKSKRSDQSISEGLIIFEGEYIYYLSGTDDLVWIDLTAFLFPSSSILLYQKYLEKSYESISYIIFSFVFGGEQ